MVWRAGFLTRAGPAAATPKCRQSLQAQIPPVLFNLTPLPGAD